MRSRRASLGFYLFQPPFLLGIGVVGAPSRRSRRRRSAPARAEDGVRRATHQALLSAAPHRGRRPGSRCRRRGDPDRDGRAARPRPRRRDLHARIPVGPRAEPPVFRRPLGLRRARTSPPDADCGPYRRQPSTRSPITPSSSASSACLRSESSARASRPRCRRR